jgi:hypothetical protein
MAIAPVEGAKLPSPSDVNGLGQNTLLGSGHFPIITATCQKKKKKQ